MSSLEELQKSRRERPKVKRDTSLVSKDETKLSSNDISLAKYEELGKRLNLQVEESLDALLRDKTSEARIGAGCLFAAFLSLAEEKGQWPEVLEKAKKISDKRKAASIDKRNRTIIDKYTGE